MSRMDIRTTQEIEQLIAKMLARYAQYYDAGEWQALADMYTMDGRYIAPDAPADVITGREAIANAHRAGPRRATRHIVSNLLVYGEHPARLTAHCTMLIYYGAPAAPDSGALPVMAPGSPLICTYDDLIVMEPKGYFFAERRAGYDFAPSPDWAAAAPPA